MVLTNFNTNKKNMETVSVNHSLIKEKKIEAREYQLELARVVAEKGNTLIVAPTALGKTIIAILTSVFVLEKKTGQKILFLSPTKPLCVQHQKTFRELTNIPHEKITLLTGTTLPQKRKELFEKSQVICATPQTIENDLAKDNIKLNETGLVVFDEAHRAVGDYAYVFVAKQYLRQNSMAPLILALTASPGSTNEHIQDVCKNLFIKNIEIRSPTSPDVTPYTNEITTQWVKLELPENFKKIREQIFLFMKEKAIALKKKGLVHTEDPKMLSRKKILEAQVRIRKELAKNNVTKPSYFSAASETAALMKAGHAIDLIETQGTAPLCNYFETLEKQHEKKASKAVKKMLEDTHIKRAIELTKNTMQKKEVHPKLEKLKEILTTQFKENKDSRVLVFNHFRDSITFLEEYLKELPEIRAVKFVGQAARGNIKGMSQKEQIKCLNEFREGKHNTLLCTSVAEEGLDIPSVDLVIFFEPVPSEIRTIQRRGRTGRLSKGKTIILMTKETRDEAYYWSAIGKEKKMHQTLARIKKTNEQTTLFKQSTLTNYVEDLKNKVLIYVDSRERNSSVAKQLESMGAIIKIKQLEVGDYVLTDEIVCERKTIEDFLESMIDGRLFQQAEKMNSNYSAPFIIIEGRSEDIYSTRNIHKNAIIGALTTLALNNKIPVFFTSGERETAEFIYVTAKREQLGKDKNIRLRVGRKKNSLAEQQQYVVESFPMVGPQLAKALLTKFGSLKKIANATEKELQKTENLGEKKAKAIKKVIESEYSSKETQNGVLLNNEIP
jgi:ERCC4-related helicase